MKILILDALTDIGSILCNQLKKAWGPPEKAGDAILIKMIVSKLDGVCRNLILSKKEVASARFPSRRGKLRCIMIGWEKFPREIVEYFKNKLSVLLSQTEKQSP
jgi:hypothetical protein